MTQANIDYTERMRVALSSARTAHEMVKLSQRLDSTNPALAVPEAIAFWRTERHYWLDSARFWRNMTRQQTRDLAAVRDWIRGKHLLVYVATEALAIDDTRHCECCGFRIVHPSAVFYWSALEDEDHINRYRLCGYCDVQAKVLANEFVHNLKHAIFNPEQAVVGWPDHRITPDE